MESPDIFMEQSSITHSQVLPLASISIHSAADTLQAIHRQTTYLQQEIQTLLDAQSIGLLAGLGHETESGNDKAYTTAVPGPIHLPVSADGPSSSSSAIRRQRVKRRPSLSTSRNRLHASLIQLADLKNSESAALEVQRESLTGFLDNAAMLTNKKRELESSIQEINSQTEGGVESLVAEETSLVSEIAGLEKRLDEAKARLRHVRRQRQEDSSRQVARLSSWQGALDEVDQKIKRDVLEGRGLEEVVFDLSGKVNKSRDVGIWNLPRERRTVELINQDITARVKNLEERRDAAERESIACHEGAELWTSCISRIEDLEQLLANEMSKLIPSKTTDFNKTNGESGMIQVVDGMAETIDSLDHELDLAELRGWNLLVCAIGAEVEALRQGRYLLQETLQTTRDESTPGTLSMMTAKSRITSDLADEDQVEKAMINSTNGHNSATPQLIDGLEEPSGSALDSQQDHNHILPKQARNVSDEDDEDAPGPELLIEHDG